MGKHWTLLFLVICLLTGCDDNDSNLPSVEERTSAALEELRDALTSPANGWRVNYQPTPESGSFFMILQFDDDGNVNIQSDLAADDGLYFDQTITYRLDAGLSLELIFETYGVFHYLFEQDQASFGAEFEFLFNEEDGDNLIFTSKTDSSDPTTITFEPASATDPNSFSRGIAKNFDSYSGQSPLIFGGINPSQQLYLTDLDLSVFWSIDLSKRALVIDLAGNGSTIQEVLSDSYQTIDQSSGYTFKNGKLVLDNPATINTRGVNFTLNEITLEEFSTSGDELCPGSGQTTPNYNVSIEGTSNGTLSKNLINSSGFGFTPQSQSIYSVNIPYIFDSNLASLSEDGSIAEKLPNAIAFIMTLGFESDTIPENSVGFLLEYDDDQTEFFLRSCDVSLYGNRLEVSFLDEYYHTGTPLEGEQQALMEITDEIFDGGILYAYDIGISGLTAFQLFNPCNSYEFVLVQ